MVRIYPDTSAYNRPFDGNMKPSEVTRFWAACQLGSGNYLALKDDLFEQESVDSLFTKVLDYQESKAEEQIFGS